MHQLIRANRVGENVLAETTVQAFLDQLRKRQDKLGTFITQPIYYNNEAKGHANIETR